MDHRDHVNLIKKGIPQPDGTWADLGSGQGAFTMALADILNDQGVIYSIDRDHDALRRQLKQMQTHFPAAKIKYIPADFTHPLDLPQLDGIVMANSLHFILDKLPVLQHLTSYLKPEGRLIMVEYNTTQGNRWVPHPITYDQWEDLAQRAGFIRTDLLMIRPSSFLGEFFSAVSVMPDDDEPNPI